MAQRVEILNLRKNERRLIAIALLRSGLDIEKAYELNCPNKEITLDRYKQKIFFTHAISFEKLRRTKLKVTKIK